MPTLSHKAPRGNVATEVLSRVTISEVYGALGGPKLRKMRGPAFWRGGDGWNVALNDAKGTWFDHVANEGGGVLELIARVRGGSRVDALRWLAELAGVPLEDKPLSPAARAEWAWERRELERDLPTARLWRRAAIGLAEEALVELKARLFDPLTSEFDVAEIQSLTHFAGWLYRSTDSTLVAAFQAFRQRDPKLTSAVIEAARHQERAERRAVARYLSEMEVSAA